MSDNDTGSTTENGDNDNQATKPGNTAVNVDNMIPKARFDQVNQQKKDAIEALKSVADSLAEDVPEDMRDIIPDLAPAQKITWIRNAIKKGIFNKQAQDGLDTKRPGGKAPVDLSKMQPEQMIATGYR